MKILMLAFFILGLSACSRVWVVSESADGGVIAYSGSATRQAVMAASKCPDTFKDTGEEVKSSTSTYTTNQKVVSRGTGTVTDQWGNTAQYNQRQVSSVPVQQTSTEYWREVSYVCH